MIKFLSNFLNMAKSKLNIIKFRFYLLGFILTLIFGLIIYKLVATYFITITKPNICTNCNILLIDIDILRADGLPCLGYFRNTTPNICKFASQATIFEDNYASATWTMPSAFSTITSLFPAFHQMQYLYIDKFNSTIPTLPGTLKKAGYFTVLITKKRNEAFLSPINNGTKDYELVTDQPVEDVIAQLKQQPRPWFLHYYRDNLEIPYLVKNPEDIIETLPNPNKIPDTFDNFYLQENIYLKKNFEKIFQPKTIAKYKSIILGPNLINDISVAMLFNDLENLSRGSVTPGEYLKSFRSPGLDSYMETISASSGADRAFVRMMYDSKLKMLDTELEHILTRFSTSAATQNTITIIMSDHGEVFGENGKFAHMADQHSQLFFTPLIIKAPNLPAVRINQPTSNLDIFPTILTLLGLDQPAKFQGLSLVPYTKNLFKPTRKFILGQEADGVVLQNKNWFYYLPIAGQLQNSVLYNKIIDPNEKFNIATNNPTLTKQLFDQAKIYNDYQAQMSSKSKNPINLTNIKLEPEKIKLLKKEGYF